MNHALRYSLLLCLLLPATTLAAERLYDVEVIVFARLQPDDQGETWPMQADETGAMPGYRFDRQIDRLGADGYALGAVRGSLQRSGQYRVLWYRAWRQPADDTSGSTGYRVNLDADGEDPRVSGAIRLLRGRYLHLAVDLQFGDSARRPAGHYLSAVDASPVYRLQEKRRVRHNELHYFDHPRYGVIAQVRPWTPPEPEAPEVPDTPDTTPQ